MATPAIRRNSHIVVAFVAEFLLVRMAVHAGIFKTHINALSGLIYVYPVTVPYNRIPPAIKQLHMLCPHEILGLDTLLDLHLINNRGIDTLLRLCAGLPHIAEEREGRKQYKNNQSCNNFSAVIHCQLPSFPGRGSPRSFVS